MLEGIARADAWVNAEITSVQFARFCRWLVALTIALMLFARLVAGLYTCVDVGVIVAVLYGELRDWSSRKQGYSLSLQKALLGSVLASDVIAFSCLLYISGATKFVPHGAWVYIVVAVMSPIYLAVGLKSEVDFQRGRTKRARIVPRVSPPLVAELFLYLILPRREREPLLGDLKEDFATDVLPKFGPLCARGWYWYKAILYAWMYACENAIEPLMGRVIEPLWRRVVLPLLKWVVAPALLVNKHRVADAIRALLERFQ